MTKTELITKFTLYLDDMSELSSTETSDLFDKVYRKVNSSRPWEGTKKEGTATQSTSVPYITMPSDFLFFTANNASGDVSEYGERPVIFVGDNYDPYIIINWSERRKYRDSDGYAYLDFTNGRIYFTKQPTSAKAVEFDYHAQKTALTSGQSPWFPAEYHDIMYHGMCIDDFIIQQSDKAKSYKSDHEKAYEDYMKQLALWNGNLQQL